MIARQDDEETPLLQRPGQPTTRTPLPWNQFWIILFLQLIRDIGVTHGDESQVGHYVGILSCCRGAFDGSNSVIKSMVMDITDVTNLPNAIRLCTNSMDDRTNSWVGIQPLIGGSLSRPADRFPDIFGQSDLLKTYPYLLPCSISATFVSIAWLVTYFRLKESVSTKTSLWELIKGGFFRQSYSKPYQPSSNVLVNPGEENSGEAQSKPLPLRALLTPKVSTVAANYATTGLFHMAFTSVLPVFYATSIELGGLSLDPPRIGVILAGTSYFSTLVYMIASVQKAIHFTGVSSGIPIVILFPVINALARSHGIGLAVWLCVAIQLALTISLIMCYPLFVRTAAPSRASLGATNGIAQMFLAGARIIGPASAASVFSYSMQEGHDAWLVYYFLTAIACLAVGVSLLLPRDPSVWEDHQ
ncbi:MFS multidrug-resistance DHA1 sub-family [Suillus subalutaceus]|uniref:MFS multidrug-resistance DHA1 sub-family n=1 Tax=Suillus subalutaceus TaxID=48586 RepID=UPI001B87561B|nr:MFS multidrug-resistance DHA1 sub-family [Suillus subalutaceus]KAG1860145.1 MFS multidrug-resistance DHA1 sub-family [Suillus subalutaceus]